MILFVRRFLDRRLGHTFHRRGAFLVIQIDGLHTADLIRVHGLAGRCIVRGGVFGPGLGTAARTAALGFLVLFFLGLLRLRVGTFFFHQRLTVSHRDLVIVGMYL